jgi:hypothetical protein
MGSKGGGGRKGGEMTQTLYTDMNKIKIKKKEKKFVNGNGLENKASTEGC